MPTSPSAARRDACTVKRAIVQRPCKYCVVDPESIAKARQDGRLLVPSWMLLPGPFCADFDTQTLQVGFVRHYAVH